MKIIQYVVEYEDPAQREAFVVDSIDTLHKWLETTLGDERIADTILGNLVAMGDVEYSSDDPYDEPSSFGLSSEDLDKLDIPTVDRLRIVRRTTKVSDAEGVLRALHRINVHRARIGQPMLDPIGSDWSVDDVVREAERLA